ncbi:helix-turn-helix domain-containing protein [Bacteroidales bacterium OttesenSCG-928-A17]|nr:helix-turn-helix domain-containing protein [Bacteroidales bacterium OttesenSCG-928-A17]
MVNTYLLFKEHPDLNITVKTGELMEMVEYAVRLSRQELEQQVADAKSETYLTRDEASKMLSVDKSTLWRWNKQSYLTHVEVGGKRLYRMSDVKQILDGGK